MVSAMLVNGSMLTRGGPVMSFTGCKRDQRASAKSCTLRDHVIIVLIMYQSPRYIALRITVA